MWSFDSVLVLPVGSYQPCGYRYRLTTEKSLFDVASIRVSRFGSTYTRTSLALTSPIHPYLYAMVDQGSYIILAGNRHMQGCESLNARLSQMTSSD
jgi:hypothetical protein